MVSKNKGAFRSQSNSVVKRDVQVTGRMEHMFELDVFVRASLHMRRE